MSVLLACKCPLSRRDLLAKMITTGIFEGQKMVRELRMNAKTKKQKKAKKVLAKQKKLTAKDPWRQMGIRPKFDGSTNKLLRLFGCKSKQVAHSQPHSQSPLLWLANAPYRPAATKQLETWNHRLLQQAKLDRLASDVLHVIGDLTKPITTQDDSLIVLGACHALRTMVGHCPFDQWNELVNSIFHFTDAIDHLTERDFVIAQHLSVEVPLTLAFQFPEIENYQLVAEKACQEMSNLVTELLDHDGWPHCGCLSDFGPLAASWVRSNLLMQKLGLECEHEPAMQLEWMVRQILRMMRPDRTIVFAPPNSRPVNESFLKALAKLSLDPGDKTLLKRFTEKSGQASTSSKLPEASNISEWGEALLLQSTWGAKVPKIAIDFSDSDCQIEISNQIGLISGRAMPSITFNGIPPSSPDAFNVVCEQSDEGLEYVELLMELGDNASLTRQFLLARNDQFALIADSVIAGQDAQIDYRCDWPLAEGVSGLHETETREVYLQDRKIQTLVLPLALPEWKAARTDDRLQFRDGCLSLSQTGNGRGLYAPLFFDLSPRRSKKKRTWRQLTVAESRRGVGSDVACAYRVQLDKRQWFFYRAIAEIGNRTFLGENTNSEFVFNEMDKHGVVTQLIEIK